MNITFRQKLRIYFALAMDKASRTFNWTRIFGFLALVVGLVISAKVNRHFDSYTWMKDVMAGGYLTYKLAGWIRFEI